jgi:hypothetical protein
MASTLSFGGALFLPVSSYILYILAISLSYIMLNAIGKINTNQQYFDEAYYANLATFINEQGLFAFQDGNRTYGYPLIVAIVQRVQTSLFPLGRFSTFVGLFQFVFHTLTALLAVACMDRLCKGQPPHRTATKLLCFAVIQLAPLLMSMTKNLLSDSLTTFFLTLFVFLLLTPHRFRPLLIGLVLAAMIVMRPFYGGWSVAFVLILVTILTVSKATRILRNHERIQLNRLQLTHTVWTALQGILPIAIIVGLQFFFIYRLEGYASLTGRIANDAAQAQLTQGIYGIKYEGYVGGTDHAPPVWYVYDRAKSLADKLAEQEGRATVWQFALHYPLEALQVFVLKATGLFQNYEWAIYRTQLVNSVSYIFLYGLLFFVFFVYVNVTVLSSLPTHLAEIAKRSPPIVVLVIIDLSILLYSVLTVPESRFAMPILPILTVLAIHFVVTRRNWRSLMFSALSATVGYIWTYQVLLASLK